MKSEQSNYKCPKCEKTFSKPDIRKKTQIKSIPKLNSLIVDDRKILYYCGLCASSYDIYYHKHVDSGKLIVDTYLLLRNPKYIDTLKDEDQYISKLKIDSNTIDI